MKTAQYVKSIALVSLVLFFTLQKGNGFVLAIFLLFFLVAAVYHAARMVQRPGERKSRGIRLAIWAVTFALAVTVQGYWSVSSRDAAELALNKVLAYKERAGTYPASLKEVGLDEEYLKGNWKLRYSVREGKPSLVYPLPFIPLALYEYDFHTGAWRKNAY